MNNDLPVVPDPGNETLLRGFEVSRWDGRTWVPVMKFRPTELGVRQAAADLRWLRERHPTTEYTLRALVSVAKPETPADDAPLHLDADDIDDATAIAPPDAAEEATE